MSISCWPLVQAQPCCEPALCLSLPTILMLQQIKHKNPSVMNVCLNLVSTRGEESLRDKWTGLLMDSLGWEQGEDIWSWVGRVKGGWVEQLQVLRSAPLMMMMMDAEEQFKTKWKRRWREAITGDPDRRIRDQMDDREVRKRVKLVDTASFTLGIVMVMTAEFLLVGYPRGFPWFYLILNTMLMMLR